MNNNKGRKRSIVAALLAGLALIVIFALVMNMIEKRGLQDEQFGDTGEWGEETTEWTLEFTDAVYTSSDDIDVYLLIGTDSGGDDMGIGMNGQLADFLTLLVIDKTTGKYGFIMIDRNTMTGVDVLDENGESKGEAYEQICIAHWYGLDDKQRNENTVKAVSELFGGLRIDGYYTLSMEDIGIVNNALGGVIVDINEDLTSIDPAFRKGETLVLTDEQADKFVRARMGVGEGTNKERMARQKQYMTSVYDMLMGELRESPEYINDLYGQLRGSLQSDTTGRDLSVISNQLVQFESQGIIDIDGHVEMHDTLNDGKVHEEFYAEESGIVEAFGKIVDLRIAE